MTYDEAYKEWYAYKGRMVKETTLAAYALSYSAHIRPVFGGMDVSAIRRKDVQGFVSGKLDGGFSVKYVRDMLHVLKMVLRFASEEHDIPVMTCWKMEWPSRNMGAGHELECYTADELRRIVAAVLAKPSPYKLGVLVALTTGMRIGEICGLRFGDIDWGRRTVHVRRTVERIYKVFQDGRPGGKTGLVISEPKTKNSRREIPLMREVVPLLGKYAKAATPDCYLCTLSECPAEPRTYRSAYRTFILKEVGLGRCIRFHGLRHTFATALVENKADIKTVSSILGHSNVSTTLNVYVHPSEEAKRNAINSALRRAFKQK